MEVNISPHKDRETNVCICLCVYTYRNDHDIVLQEDLVSIRGGGTIGTLGDDLHHTETKNTQFTQLQPRIHADLKVTLKPRVTGTCSHLGLDPGSIVTCELLLSGSRDQDVTVSLQNVPVVGFRPRKAHNGAMVLQKNHVVNMRQFVQTIRMLKGEKLKMNNNFKINISVLNGTSL